MTPNEFSTWLDMHQALFPGLVQWLALNEDRGLLLDEWQTVLRKVSLASCKAASRAILDGRMEAPFYSELPKCIRAWAAELDLETRQQVAEQSHNPKWCELCSNTGFVVIWHPLLVRAVREDVRHPCGFRDPKTGKVVVVFRADGSRSVIDAAVVCKCQAGEKFRVTKRKNTEVVNEVYGDSLLHVPITTGDYEADIARHMPDNFVQEFAEF
jgi:hypothetical protein